MNYETFLFTRNQRRDFTAFIRPKDLTNKEISTIASALNYVNDISELSQDWPALYCFPIGEYVLLLRHYDSGRTHAGRNVGVLEGIAVKRTRARHFSLAVPHFLAHQQELLNISATVADIESATMQNSPEHPWPDVQAMEATGAAADELVNTFVARLNEDRLFIPFDEDGRAMLITALSDSRLPALYFAFGTNSDVLNRLHQAEIAVDIVSYFNTTTPSLRSRETNEITSELTDYVSRSARPRRQKTPVEKVKTDSPEAALPTPRQAKADTRKRPPQDNKLGQYSADDANMLTPRQMARKQAEEQKAAAIDDQPKESESALSWLGHLIARLLGRK